MAIYLTGNGGSLSIKVPAAVLDLTSWQLTSSNRLADVSTSAQSYSRFFPTLEDNSWSVELPVDSSNRETTAGLVEGAVVTLSFKEGAAANLFHQLVNTTVERVSDTCNNAGDVIRLSISGKGGGLLKYQPAIA